MFLYLSVSPGAFYQLNIVTYIPVYVASSFEITRGVWGCGDVAMLRFSIFTLLITIVSSGHRTSKVVTLSSC